MEMYGDMKIKGDAYAGGFSCGLSMSRSETWERLKIVEEQENKIVYEDDRAVKLEVISRKVGDGKRICSKVTNNGNKPITLEMLASVGLKSIEADKFYRMHSFWSAEGRLKVESIYDLHMEKSWNGCATRVEKFGNVGSMPVRKYFPFLVLENSKTGEFVGIELCVAGSWQIEITCKEEDKVNVSAGLADRDFGQWTKTINPGESFVSPEAIIAYGDSIYDVCHKLLSTVEPDVSPVDDHMGIIYNEYCTTWGNPTFDNVKKICDKIADKGIQYLVIDSGWYGTGDMWWNSVGDWEVNQERFAGGMKPIADYIRSKGMIPGLWYEMESVTTGSKYYAGPEHLVLKDGVPLTVGNRHFWDMEDPWVIDYLSEKVIGLLKSCGFGYLKVDYNDTIGIGCDDPDGFGEGLRKKVEASREFFRKIKREIPDIVIENCSSGGHRLTQAMMELVSQASFSDAHEITSLPIIAANVSRVIKSSQSQIWVVVRENDSDNRLFYSICGALFGRLCFSGEIYSLSDHQWKIVDDGMDFYRKAADIIKDGKTTYLRQDTESYNNPTGNQLFIREKDDLKMAVLHRFENSLNEDLRFLDGHEIIAEFGAAEEDFSAKAWIYK